MKYLFLLLGSHFLLAGAAHAQLGVRLGGNLARLATGEGQTVHSSSGALAGYQVGVLYQLPLHAHVSLVPEVQYSYERLTLSQTSTTAFNSGFTADTRWRRHYLSAPVLVRLTFGAVYVEAGPLASLLLGGRQTGTQVVRYYGTGVPPRTEEIDEDATQTTAGFDVGACLGLGARLPAGFGLSVRAYHGLVATNNAPSGYEGAFYRQSLQASLTYQFPAR